jgi:hypothetical protein
MTNPSYTLLTSLQVMHVPGMMLCDAFFFRVCTDRCGYDDMNVLLLLLFVVSVIVVSVIVVAIIIMAS